MGKLILAMNVSLDGYVDDTGGNLVMAPPSAVHFRYWIERVRACAGSIYGRRMYDLMRYWDDDRPEWDADRAEFARVWRAMPKWVASRNAIDVGPNATPISGDVVAVVRRLKETADGTLSVSGPELAGQMTQAGLIDEYHLHVRPFVLGTGKPFFDAAGPPLRLVSSTLIDADTPHLVYAPT